MSNTNNRPTHQLVRYYGEGRNAPRGNIGAMWTGEDGRVTILINTPTEQIRIIGFPASDDASATANDGGAQ